MYDRVLFPVFFEERKQKKKLDYNELFKALFFVTPLKKPTQIDFKLIEINSRSLPRKDANYSGSISILKSVSFHYHHFHFLFLKTVLE